MKQAPLNPSWHQIEKATAIIAQKILKEQINFDWVVGLTRGGLVPAVLFSQMLDLPMMSVNYSSPDGAGDNKNHNNFLPHISGDFVSGSGRAPHSPKLLIIDDIADTGHTLREVVNHYERQGHSVWTATLYYKQGSVVVPHFWMYHLDKDAPWVVFPWEI